MSPWRVQFTCRSYGAGSFEVTRSYKYLAPPEQRLEYPTMTFVQSRSGRVDLKNNQPQHE
jgi:hypothetical protein